MGREDRIKEFEEELKKTKYNKRTQHHVGLVKAKIAKLKEEIEQKKKGKGVTTGYVLRKTGDATVALLGFPSVGKSTLLNAITNADSKVAAYEFTTLDVIPGLLEHKQAKIQIFDVPGILEGAADGTGRGREVLAAIRSADMVIMVLDINQLHHKPILEKEVYDTGIRLNKKKPDVKITKQPKGGVSVASTVKLEMSKETIKAILNEFKITNADILIRTHIDDDELIDCVEGNKKYMPGLVILNKIDTATPEKLKELKEKYPDAVMISADKGTNLEEMREEIFKRLQFIRVYLKEPGKEPDMKEPMIMRENDDMERLCEKLHKDFVKKFKFARVWGKSAKYDGQKITNLKHVIMDKDIVEVHLN